MMKIKTEFQNPPIPIRDKLLREHNRLRRQWERQMIKRIEKLRTAALAILSAKEKVNQ